MTPLRFRAWHTVNKKMIPVKALAFAYCDDMGFKGPELLVLQGKPYDDENMPESMNGKAWQTAPLPGESSQYRTCIVMQSTGLKDKNGKEIFEGDFLHVADRHYVVKWSEHKSGWHVEALGGEKHRTIGYCRLFGKVIGNVWENPDLLNPPTKTP